MDLFSPGASFVLFAVVVYVVITTKVYAKTGGAETKRVLDGDTVIVKQGFRSHKIRLAAIDCPAPDQPWSSAATAGLVKLIGGKRIKLEVHGVDKYDRSIATILVWDNTKSEWINVNARMILLGHAWLYRQFVSHLPEQKQFELSRMEYWARTRRVGLWQYRNPTPPWEWRHRTKVEVIHYTSKKVVQFQRRRL